jgi:Fe-S cluster assembly protein SufD
VNAPSPVPQILRAHADAHGRSAASLPGGAGWRRRRSQALERLLRLGLPTTHDEAWKYAPLRDLAARPVDPTRTSGGPPADTLVAPFSVPGARRLVFADGRFVPALSDEPANLDDLDATFLCDLLRGSPDALLAQLPVAGDLPEDRFTLLNDAFLSDGLSIRVPGGAAPAPLHLQFAASSDAHAVHPRVLIDVQPGAHLQVIEQHSSPSASHTIDNAVTQIELHEGATLEHYLLIDGGAHGHTLHGSYVTQHKDSHLIQHRVLLGGELTRASVQARLTGRGAAIEINSLALAPGGEYADAHSIIEHRAPATRSQERFRAAAGARGRCVFNGRIVVQAGAAGSDSLQSSRGLLLAPGAEIDSRPQLEIYTDDVKCTHGATTGRLDEDMLFYLLSRGIDTATARGLLIFAFLDDVVTRMGIDSLRRFLEQRIAASLPDAPIIREFL